MCWCRSAFERATLKWLVHFCTDPSDVKTPRSTDTCTIASDEGYMSPAEDLASLLSADDNEAPKAYVQARTLIV